MALIIGTKFNDILVGTNSDDTIFDMDGNDTIVAGGGNDACRPRTGIHHQRLWGADRGPTP